MTHHHHTVKCRCGHQQLQIDLSTTLKRKLSFILSLIKYESLESCYLRCGVKPVFISKLCWRKAKIRGIIWLQNTISANQHKASLTHSKRQSCAKFHRGSYEQGHFDVPLENLMVDYSGNLKTSFKKRIWISNNKLYQKSIDMSGLISSSSTNAKFLLDSVERNTLVIEI